MVLLIFAETQRLKGNDDDDAEKGPTAAYTSDGKAAENGPHVDDDDTAAVVIDPGAKEPK